MTFDRNYISTGSWITAEPRYFIMTVAHLSVYFWVSYCWYNFTAMMMMIVMIFITVVRVIMLLPNFKQSYSPSESKKPAYVHKNRQLSNNVRNEYTKDVLTSTWCENLKYNFSVISGRIGKNTARECCQYSGHGGHAPCLFRWAYLLIPQKCFVIIWCWHGYQQLIMLTNKNIIKNKSWRWKCEVRIFPSSEHNSREVVTL